MINFFRDKRYAWIPAATASAVMLALAAWLFPGWVQRIERSVYDQAARSNHAAPPPDLAIIAIDDASIAKLGSWPWPHSVHTRLLENLTKSGVATIAFTIPLSESPTESQRRSGLEQLRAAIVMLDDKGEDNSDKSEQLKTLLTQSVADLDEDAGLAQAISRHGNVLLPAEVVTTKTNATATLPTELRRPASILLQRSKGIAHLALVADNDGIVRGDRVLLANHDNVPSMAVALTALREQHELSSIAIERDTLIIDSDHYALDAQQRWQTRFYDSATPQSIKKYSYWEVLSGAIAADRLQGSTVLIGLTEANTALIKTPMGEQPLVQVIAGMTASLSSQNGYQHPTWCRVIEWLLAISMIALNAWLLPSLRLWLATLGTVLWITALVFLEIALLNLTDSWLQLMLPAFVSLGGLMGVVGFAMLKRQLRGAGQNGEAIASLRMLGQTFQNQGQLDLALETFRRCPMDTQIIESMYALGLDYEKRHQFARAGEIYTQISAVDAHYKDVTQRRDQAKRAQETSGPSTMGKAAATRESAPARKQAAPTPISASRKPTIAAPPPRPKAAVEDFDHVVRKPEPKRKLGRYEIERELGKGAMGVVYLGRDPKINRIVAIKAIALANEFAEDDLADARERFFREAEMAGRLNHPGIVTVYDAGEDQGLAYIAMEFLRGEHLSHYADPTHLLSIPKVLALGARLAEALDYAHRQNVVHRDIKPANIMFNADTDEIKLTDFGIARLTDTSKTKTGIVLGTPSFMSPEQLEGRPLDGRSDLFSLGVSLYQLLTGQLPFRAESMTRLMHKIAAEPHSPVRALRPELPEMAEQIITRALAKSSADRYQTGTEMATALRSCIRLVARKEAIAR